MPLFRRTRATLRSAEFGFWGAPLSAGVASLRRFDLRPLRTSCCTVGTNEPLRTYGGCRHGRRGGNRGDGRPAYGRPSGTAKGGRGLGGCLVLAGGQVDDLGAAGGGAGEDAHAGVARLAAA